MNKIWYGIADFFKFVFSIIEDLGNILNYIYIVVIFIFLVVWTSKMIGHKKNNEEHASS
mgnify:CR=1 FL=1